MNKRMVWLIALTSTCGLYVPAEVVITSPTGTPDESDVVLEKAVDAVKELPAESVKVVGDTLRFVADEVRNTTHGVKSVFKGDTPRETVRETMLNDVSDEWSADDELLLCTYAVSPAVGAELLGAESSTAATIDVRGFFKGIDFSEGATAYYRPEGRRLVVFNTMDGLRAIEEVLSSYHHAEQDFKQVEIKAKFIEVNQSSLDQLGFSWEILDTDGITGVRLFDDWQVDAPQDVLAAGVRTAAGAFGGGVPAAGSMVLSKGGWMPLSLTIDALEQQSDTDVLSSPSITTKAGTTAQIWVGEDRMIPGRFEVNSQDVNVHVQHTDWDSQLMGVHFSVSPEILADNTIRLELKPKIVDLLGYDTYQVSPESSMMMIHGGGANTYRGSGRYPILNVPSEGISKTWDFLAATLGKNPNEWSHEREYSYYGDTNKNYSYIGNGTASSDGYYSSYIKQTHEEFGVPLPANYGSLPYFRVREIETTVDVADGSTVGLGGLIYDRLETYKDKVPVLGSIPLLGRLFRSEGERSIKRNLMIFVTATQVKENGQRKSDLSRHNEMETALISE